MTFFNSSNEGGCSHASSQVLGIKVSSSFSSNPGVSKFLCVWSIGWLLSNLWIDLIETQPCSGDKSILILWGSGHFDLLIWLPCTSESLVWFPWSISWSFSEVCWEFLELSLGCQVILASDDPLWGVGSGISIPVGPPAWMHGFPRRMLVSESVIASTLGINGGEQCCFSKQVRCWNIWS